MGLIKKIKNGFKYFKNYEKEQFETEKREEELVEIVKRLRNIDIFGKKQVVGKLSISQKNDEKEENYFTKKQENLAETVEKLKNIKLFEPRNEIVNNDSIKKIEVISMINIEKMSDAQLQNTYKCVKKSIYEAKHKGKTAQLNELIELKNKIKTRLIKEHDSLNLQSIKCNLMLGNIEKIDIYENVLLGLYNELENNKFKGYDSDIQQMKIYILSLIKLINKIKKSNKTYIKKIA